MNEKQIATEFARLMVHALRGDVTENLVEHYLELGIQWHVMELHRGGGRVTEILALWLLQLSGDAETARATLQSVEGALATAQILSQTLKQGDVSSARRCVVVTTGTENDFRDLIHMLDETTRLPAPRGWIQWKGTSVCIDLVCQCGHDWHMDTEFMYYVRCPKCSTVSAVSAYVKLQPLTPEDEALAMQHGCVCTAELEEE